MVIDMSWQDAARMRDIPVRVRIPVSAGPWPVVLHSHGLGGSRDGGDAWGSAWSTAGFLVVHLQHAGSDMQVLREGRFALSAAVGAEQLAARVADVRFALDEIARRQRRADAFWALAGLDAVGLSGHSFGARTAQAMAGEKFPVPTQFADARLKAFIALSPSSSQRLPVSEQFAAVNKPFLAVTGSLDGDPMGGFSSGEPRARVYQGLPAGQRALLWLDGADHMTFSGNAERRINGPGPLPRQPLAQQREVAHHALVARVTTLWWRARLLDDAAATAALQRVEGLVPGDRLELG